jgi:Cof subfamily protein (haloacid dehalogenase superfamily)
LNPHLESRGPFSIAAFDVDGTLTDPSGDIDPKTIGLLRDLAHHGVLVVIATARGPKGVKTIATAIGGDMRAVTYQGALIGGFHKARWSTHAETMLDLEVAHHICDLASASGLASSWHAGESWFATALTGEIVRESTIVKDSPVVVADHRHLSAAPHKLMFISPPSEIVRLEEFCGALPPSVDYSYSHPNYLEVSPPGVNKGTAMTDLISRVRGRSLDAVAFGDGLNDVAMFENVGYSVAMAHAPRAVQLAASDVATSGLVDTAREFEWRAFEV